MVKGWMGGSTISEILPCVWVFTQALMVSARLRVAEVEVGHLRPVELPVPLHEIRQERDAQLGPERVRRLERHLGIGARQARPERGMRPVDLIQAQAFQAEHLGHRPRGLPRCAVVGHAQRCRQAGGRNQQVFGRRVAGKLQQQAETETVDRADQSGIKFLVDLHRLSLLPPKQEPCSYPPNIRYTNIDLISSRAANACISSSDGARSNRLAASSTFGRTLMSPTVFRKMPGRPKT